jgi:hypothetical protein
MLGSKPRDLPELVMMARFEIWFPAIMIFRVGRVLDLSWLRTEVPTCPDALAERYGSTRALRWTRSVGQSGGLFKLGSGCRQAASLSVPLVPYASSDVRPARRPGTSSLNSRGASCQSGSETGHTGSDQRVLV